MTVTEDDRVFFYFAGHGIALEALENQEGPVGYLIPQDATSGDSSSSFSTAVEVTGGKHNIKQALLKRIMKRQQ